MTMQNIVPLSLAAWRNIDTEEDDWEEEEKKSGIMSSSNLTFMDSVTMSTGASFDCQMNLTDMCFNQNMDMNLLSNIVPIW